MRKLKRSSNIHITDTYQQPIRNVHEGLSEVLASLSISHYQNLNLSYSACSFDTIERSTKVMKVSSLGCTRLNKDQRIESTATYINITSHKNFSHIIILFN